MTTTIEPLAAPLGTGIAPVLHTFLTYKQLRIVTRDDGKVVIITSFSLSGDVIATIDPNWLKRMPLESCAALVAEHSAEARKAFGGLWTAIDRWVVALRMALGLAVGAAAHSYSGNTVEWLLGLGAAALPPRITLYPFNVAARLYFGHLLKRAG